MPAMPDKKEKMKALDLMIVVGKPKKGMPEGEEEMDMNHKGCKCPCCGAPCEECAKGMHESEDKESEDEGEEY
jgi:hypothetical protein